jgi:carboxypeptidase Taq
MEPETKLSQLKTLLNEVFDLYNIIGLLQWDQQVNQPPGGTQNRSYQLSTLYRLYHSQYTSDEIGRLLEDLGPYAAQLEPDSDDARLIRVTTRRYRKLTSCPQFWWRKSPG